MEATLSASGHNKSVYSAPRHTPVSRDTRQVWGHKLLLKCTVIEISFYNSWRGISNCCNHFCAYYYYYFLFYTCCITAGVFIIKPPLRQSYNPYILHWFYFTRRCEIEFPQLIWSVRLVLKAISHSRHVLMPVSSMNLAMNDSCLCWNLHRALKDGHGRDRQCSAGVFT